MNKMRLLRTASSSDSDSEPADIYTVTSEDGPHEVKCDAMCVASIDRTKFVYFRTRTDFSKHIANTPYELQYVPDANKFTLLVWKHDNVEYILHGLSTEDVSTLVMAQTPGRIALFITSELSELYTDMRRRIVRMYPNLEKRTVCR